MAEVGAMLCLWRAGRRWEVDGAMESSQKQKCEARERNWASREEEGRNEMKIQRKEKERTREEEGEREGEGEGEKERGKGGERGGRRWGERGVGRRGGG